MMEDLYFSQPRLLLLVPLILVAGIASLRWNRNRLLVLSRTVIFCLLAVALANPYLTVTETTQSRRPLITVVSDLTASTEIFDRGAADRVGAEIPDSTIRTFSGRTTPLGDKILQYAQQGGALLLVTDGYSNAGRSLEESLALARSANSTVFALEMEPVREDYSVEISGTNTAVLGGDYPFSVLVRSSGGDFEGVLIVRADDLVIYQNAISGEGRSASIKISHRFSSTGTHLLEATIAFPQDARRENDRYQKAVYVVPKPEVLLVAEEESPLSEVLSQQYRLTTAASFRAEEPGSGVDGYKAVVLDDQRYGPELSGLKDYVREGGGLVVVGGEDSFDFGDYRNTSLEEVLPVKSVPSIFEGGKITVIIMDISGSTRREMSIGGATFLDYEKSLAIELLKSPEFRDDRVALVVFGTEAFVVFTPTPIAGKEIMIADRISSLSPQPGAQEETQLDTGLALARDILNSTAGVGEVIVISDGRVREYPQVFEESTRMIQEMTAAVHLVEVKSFVDAPGGFADLAARSGAEYHSAVYPSSVTIRTEERPETEEPPEEEEVPASGYSLMIADQNHYITSDLNITANATGFNDVTPKPGGQRLVVMLDGKPILTSWRYGLGRVAALTTDDGTAWAPEVYSAENSRLVSRTVNWAIGDPRPEAGRVDAEDGWLGTPLEITITSPSPPRVGSAQVERVGENRYRATVTPEEEGVYTVGDYGIAINYPLEFRYVGYNPEFSRLIMSSGGMVFNEAEVARSLVDEARKRSEITIQQRVSSRWTLLFAALAIFLAEVIIRRLREVKR
ncbi:MAG TPA: VWA domain-containing protein [Methanothrix sp.]|nr:VWA domain-containing protein [Methanothrix sp.]